MTPDQACPVSVCTCPINVCTRRDWFLRTWIPGAQVVMLRHRRPLGVLGGPASRKGLRMFCWCLEIGRVFYLYLYQDNLPALLILVHRYNQRG